MKRKVQMRLWGFPLLSALAILAGLGIGVWLGYYDALRQTRIHLEQYATRTLAEADASSAEARRVLDLLRTSPLTPCSDADLFDLRRLVFESEYLKDVGRVEQGQIACAAIAWRLARPVALPEKRFITQDGLSAYDRFVPPNGGGGSAFALGQDGAFIVFSPHIEERRAAPPIRYLSSAVNDPLPGRGNRDWPELNGNILTTDSSGRQGRIVYATHCSARYYNCITGWMPTVEALALNRRAVAVYGLLGGLVSVLGIAGVWLLRLRGWDLQHQLRGAIRRREISLVYQPIVDLRTRRMVGAEALARWQDRAGNPVSPEIFVPLAVRHGLITPLTRHILRRALWEMRELLSGPGAFQLSVNVTAQDLADPRFPAMLRETLDAVSVAPGRLSIEITEGSTARGAAEFTIQHLREAGFSVHIDDFGTGYSSLAYLQDLDVDAIKIDRAFTRAVGTGAANMAVLPRVMAMAEALHLGVIVEGIETEEQATYFAQSQQPLQGQGWLFGRPMHAEDLRERVQRQQQERPAAPDNLVVMAS